MPKNQTSKKPKHNKKFYIILAITAVVLLIGSNFAYTTYSNYRDTQLDQADRQRFETVHRSVSKLHQRLQKAAAPGVEWEMDTFCRKGSVKFQKALKSCDITTATTVRVTEPQLNQIIKKYNSVFTNSSKNFQFKRYYEKEPPDVGTLLSKELDGAVYRHKQTGMKCEGYFFKKEKSSNKKLYSLDITFSCGDYSRELYYPEKS